MEPLPSKYSSQQVEEKWYRFWEENGLFTPQSDLKKKPYTVVIPPPNVTGILHMGHALNNTIQDILVRWHRAKGDVTLWIPGTDHAGIATQNVVEKKLAQEGKTRHSLGREKFVQEVWKWKEQYGSTIIKQLRRLGASCDFTRERFTMDEGLSRAVREVFVRLYKKDLIYRGNYIINWCPRCHTALSDEEAVHQEVSGFFYHILYPVIGTDKTIEIATTRPETMLGDTAVAIHPKDDRYRFLIGKKVKLPLLNKPIPVIEDELVDPEFGTGVVKVTPAHDPADFVMGRRHGLEEINVLTIDGKINEKGEAYKGLDRFAARKKIVEDLEAQGLFVKKVPHRHAVGHCYRCHTIVEPYLSKQWFVKMKPLAEKALKAEHDHKVHFHPPRFIKIYTHWLENIRDWCISRQIWWGHQIPVWYCQSCPENKGTIVALEAPKECPNCKGHDLVQDPDVLDTWFSSWLWPFSTLGWPEKTKDLDYFYPTNDLVSAQEILFFWIARMIMAGLEIMDEVPFSHVVIHGTVRDIEGRKMSKSLGNSIDPLETINQVGADALRFTLMTVAGGGQDALLSEDKFEIGRNFTNKIWNATRFSLMNLEGFSSGQDHLSDVSKMDVIHQWIVSRLNHTAQTIDEKLSAYRIGEAVSTFYEFFWGDFCDWYLELIKPLIKKEGKDKENAQKVLFFILEESMRMLQPVMPHLAEEVWQYLKNYAKSDLQKIKSVMIAPWPSFKKEYDFPKAENQMQLLQSIVMSVRDLRQTFGIEPARALKLVIKIKEEGIEKTIEAIEPQILHFARLESIELNKIFKKSSQTVQKSLHECDLFVFVEGLIDREAERMKIEKEIARIQNLMAQIVTKLENQEFVKNAPTEVVENERTKEQKFKQMLMTLQENRSMLEGD